MKTLVILCVVLGCGSRDERPPTREAATVKPVVKAEVGTPTCDKLIAYERACMAALRPGYDDGRGKAMMEDFERRIDHLKRALRDKTMPDPVQLVEGECQAALEQERYFAKVSPCPTIVLP
jgi:hypothetical protein